MDQEPQQVIRRKQNKDNIPYMVSCRSVYNLIGLQNLKLMKFTKNVWQSIFLIFMSRFMKSNRDVIYALRRLRWS